MCRDLLPQLMLSFMRLSNSGLELFPFTLDVSFTLCLELQLSNLLCDDILTHGVDGLHRVDSHPLAQLVYFVFSNSAMFAFSQQHILSTIGSSSTYMNGQVSS